MGRCKEDYTFYLNGRATEQVNSMCDIGVFAQSHLKFTTHCNSFVKRPHYLCSEYF